MTPWVAAHLRADATLATFPGWAVTGELTELVLEAKIAAENKA
tara:strand:- start:3408 stop:3536 length:129 start_codon:yes stop_codon:yes gene_type:complete